MTRGADKEVGVRLVRRQASRWAGSLRQLQAGGLAARAAGDDDERAHARVLRGRQRRRRSRTSGRTSTTRSGLGCSAPGLDAPRQALAHVLARTRKGRLRAALRFRLPSAKSKAAEMGRAGMEPALSPRLWLRSCYRARG